MGNLIRRHPSAVIAALALALGVASSALTVWSRAEAAPIRERMIVLETILPEIRSDVKDIKDEVKEMRRYQQESRRADP
jgi:hypothetical protein